MRPAINAAGEVIQPQNNIVKLAELLRHLPGGDAVAGALLAIVQHEIIAGAEKSNEGQSLAAPSAAAA